jgi:ABC-type multidrug transport system permease subunit
LTNFVSLTRMRIQLALRNRMFIFFSVIMPMGFFFLYSGVFAQSIPYKVAYYLGPILSLTVMGSFWGLSAALVMFREQGILRRFHVTPVTPGDMLASSIVANYVLTLPTVAVELFFARTIFHVHNFGDWSSIILLMTVGTISFGSLGLVVASVTNTMQETQVINQLLWLPLIFLSGATFPLAFLPKTVQRVGLFLPATYLVNGLQQAVFHDRHPWQLLVESVSLGSWAVLTFFVSSQLFRWEPESKIPRKAKLWALATAIPFFFLGIWEIRKDDIIREAKVSFFEVEHPTMPQMPPSVAQPEKPSASDPGGKPSQPAAKP